MKEILQNLLKEPYIKIILSKPSKKTNEFKRATLVPKLQKGNQIIQIERATDKQVFHENILPEEAVDKICLMMDDFRQINCFSETVETEIKISKKGQIFVSSRKTAQPIKAIVSHNRKKNYILNEGEVIEPLIDLGIFTKEGKIVHSMYDKYKQINRFLELVDDVVKTHSFDTINILDFGCGKSYLTFILYYYLTTKRGIKARITGLDLKKDVIEHCNEVARKYGYDGLHFEIGDIQNYRYTDQVDMVITLHACDTATDYALFNAIRWNARFILSVPCCQHELNAQIKSDDYSILTKYGLIKERVSALMTDAIRANCLQAAGYKTQVIEFIDMDHSLKNILLRAVKQNIPDAKKKEAVLEIKRLCEQFSCDQTLVRLLQESGKLSF